MANSLELSVDISSDLDPLEYPGKIPEVSGLLRNDRFGELRLRPGRRVPQGRVAVSTNGQARWQSLNEVLLRENVASMDSRAVVIAVGSNAAPAVMARKFQAAGVSTVIPFVRCTVSGMSVGHSAHISKRGYIAVTPYDDPGNVTAVSAQWLDSHQLGALDATEPNYQRVRLDSTDYPLMLENGERPSHFFLYLSRWGVLTADGHPQQLQPQQDLHSWLRRDPLVTAELGDGSAAETAARLGDPDRQVRLREHWAAQGHTQASGLVKSDDQSSILYGGTPSLLPPTDSGDEWLRCSTSPDDLLRRGEPCVVVGMSTADRLGDRNHAVVRASFAAGRPGVLARVVGQSDVAPDEILVDQAVRNALGVELQEYLTIDAADVPPHRVADSLLSRPKYILARVQPADIVTTEQNACLLLPLAMNLLGLAEGDTLVIEGVPTATRTAVPVRRMRAHAAPDSVLARRENLSGGSFDTRFPSASDALGIYPDLGWVFLDSTNRQQLGLGSSKLTVVRLRASRRFQVMRELRELLLLLVLALIGLANVVPSPAILLVVALIIGCITVLVGRSRLKQRLGES